MRVSTAFVLSSALPTQTAVHGWASRAQSRVASRIETWLARPMLVGGGCGIAVRCSEERLLYSEGSSCRAGSSSFTVGLYTVKLAADVHSCTMVLFVKENEGSATKVEEERDVYVFWRSNMTKLEGAQWRKERPRPMVSNCWNNHTSLGCYGWPRSHFVHSRYVRSLVSIAL